MPRNRLLRSTVAVACLLAAVVAAAGSDEREQALIDHVSFAAPFNKFNVEGSRIVPNFATGGSTTVNKHFLRLTPDRQSKRGYIWSTRPSGSNEWVATLKFRISGQGRTLFGDGLAFWYTSSTRYAQGSLHGATGRFNGVAVVFDTFRNTEAGANHRDISILLNDGKNDWLELGFPEVPGCDSRFRLHEGRDDFDVTKHAVARISYVGGRLSVQIDARGDGQFVDCASVEATLPRSGHVGLTASTGHLADNHDVLALIVQAVKGGQLPALPDVRDVVPESETGAGDAATGEVNVETLVKGMESRLRKRATLAAHAQEHALTAVKDSLSKTLGKLQKQELEAENRIAVLEEKMRALVNDELAGRVQKLEARLAQQAQKQMEEAGRSWQLPFIVILCILVALAVAGWSKYNYLLKRDHLL